MKKLALIAAIALTDSACTWTNSAGDQVVLTPQNALSLIVDKIRQRCPEAASDAAFVEAGLKIVNASTDLQKTVSDAGNTAVAVCALIAPSTLPAVPAQTTPGAIVPSDG